MSRGRKRNRTPTQRPTTRDGRTAEREDKIMGVVLAQPHRRGERSQRAGFVLGRLRLSEQISEEQFQAGERYASLAQRHMRYVLGCSYHWPTTSLANSVGGGAMQMSAGDLDTDELERQWADAMTALAEHGLLVRRGNVTSGSPFPCMRALSKVCIVDQFPNEAELGDLRLALNALYRLWSRETRRQIHTIANIANEAA